MASRTALTFVDIDAEDYIGVKLDDKLIWHGHIGDVESLLGRLGFDIDWQEDDALDLLSTDELDDMLKKGSYAENDKEMAMWGRKISKYIRETELTTFLWANHSPWGMNKRITNWETTLGGMPPIEFETIEIAK